MTFYIYAIILTIVYILYYIICIGYDLMYSGKTSKKKDEVEEFSVEEEDETPKQVQNTDDGYTIDGVSQTDEDVSEKGSEKPSSSDEGSELYNDLKKRQGQLAITSPTYENEFDLDEMMIAMSQPASSNNRIKRELVSI